MSRWAKLDVPSLKLASQLDTDHWAKLKGKVSIKYQNIFSFPFRSIQLFFYIPKRLVLS